MPKLYNLLNSFRYAFRGVSHAFRTQRNMRIHGSLALTAIAFGCFYGLAAMEWVGLCFTIVFVLVCEMFNTALENAVDVATSEYHEKARVAKDVAAGAVLLSAALSVAVAFFLFCDLEKLSTAFLLIAANPIAWAGCLIGAVLLLWWIFRT